MAQSNTLILRILEELRSTDEHSPINAKGLAEKLDNNYGLPIKRQMVYELIAVLKDCGYEIESCPRKNDGWYMKHHSFSDYQLKIMIDAITQSKCLTEKESTQIMRELMKLTSDRGRRKLLSVYAPKPGTKPTTNKVNEFLDLILEATLSDKKIIFNYTSCDSNLKRVVRVQDGKPKEYELNVFCLDWADDNYYVIGGHDKHKPSLTQYRLDRIENLRISDNRMISKKDFLGDNPDYKIQSFLEKEVDHFSGDVIRITLEFKQDDPTLTILSDFAGPDVRIRNGADGLSLASFRKSNSPTLIGWLLRFGDKFKVVEPASLQEEVKDFIRKLTEVYEL